MMKLNIKSKSMVALLGWTILFPLSVKGAEWHHVHLTTTNGKAAAAWYIKYFGGRLVTEGPYAGTFTTLDYGNALIRFFEKEPGFEGSVGGSIDHIGFSVADVEAKVKEMEAAGVKVLSPSRYVETGKFHFAFVTDPWGVKIELIDDTDYPGFHHLHVLSPEPDATIRWYSDTFGGEKITTFRGLAFLPAILFDDVWLVATKGGPVAPSAGRAIDHLGWSFSDLGGTAVRLRAAGIPFTIEPRPFGELKIAFIEGPDGTRIELVQPPVAVTR